MSKFNIVKFILTAFIVLALNACASLNENHHSSKSNGILLAAPSEPAIESYSTNFESMRLSVPEFSLEVREVPLAVTVPDTPSIPDTPFISTYSDEEISCMARVIYFEARGEVTLGKIGVGYVVLNRMNHREFPKTVCAVVYQRSGRRCQFSWVCDGIPDKIRDPQSYERARTIAVQVLSRSVENPVGGSLFFRHRSIGGRHARNQKLYASIGQHSFFASLR